MRVRTGRSGNERGVGRASQMKMSSSPGPLNATKKLSDVKWLKYMA
jgi:hypothetical protein